jgi:hypothetical protein
MGKLPEDEMVEVRFGRNPLSARERARGVDKTYVSDSEWYAYRTGGLSLNQGDLVAVPSQLASGEHLARVVRIGSRYDGPTSRVLRKHVHRYKTVRQCSCGREIEVQS